MFRFIYFFSLLLFFAFGESDVVNYLCSMALSRPAQPWPWLCATLLAAAFSALAYFMEHRFCQAKSRNPYPVYVLTSCLATIFVSIPFASTIRMIALPLVAIVLGILISLWMKRLQRLSGKEQSLWQQFMPPTIVLTLLGLYMGLGAATPDYVHYELRTAQALRSDNPQRAYEVGKVSLATSPRLFALRCYLMAVTNKQGLAADIFRQPIPPGGSANLLFPNDYPQSLMLPPDTLYKLLGDNPKPQESCLAYLRRLAVTARKGNRNEKYLPAIDYYLCALLLDRQLDLFAREIQTFYPIRIKQHKLADYYAQALVFYTRSRTQPSLIYHDAAIEANLLDYSEMGDTITDADCRRNLLRRSYGETYWWWYEYTL